MKKYRHFLAQNSLQWRCGRETKIMKRLGVDCRAPPLVSAVAFAGLGMVKVLWEVLLEGVTAVV